jgi:hypothetical protein
VIARLPHCSTYSHATLFLCYQFLLNIDRSRFTGIFFNLLYRHILLYFNSLSTILSFSSISRFTIWFFNLQYIVHLILEEIGVDAFECYDDGDGRFRSVSTLFHYYNIERDNAGTIQI